MKVAGRLSTDDSMTDQRETGRTSRTVGLDKGRLSAFEPLVISTYNVRTLHQKGKIHQLFMGCADAGVDIIGIQEHRLITSNYTEEIWSDDRNWVMVYSSATKQRQGDCLPTPDKDDFYTSLTDYLDQVKRHKLHLVLGDFNARVWLYSHLSHPEVIGGYCHHNTTNDNGERLVNLCQEHKMRPAQMKFPQPRSRQWTWSHPAGSVYHLDHILINSKWINSLRNCRAYNSVELDSDHRIVSIRLVTSLRTSKGKPCKRPKFNWKKLQDPVTREMFQLELSIDSKFLMWKTHQVLQIDMHTLKQRSRKLQRQWLASVRLVECQVEYQTRPSD
ncbi:craniofacial development protein 2-like [Patiria miniata]|uniref:Endonuclease/exonuclease/phosphatase domain-containing protein n=1 Tax=Patiria miniata TaxID=46514 RepID=A0A914AHJ4_PATMI|nr:craniofacial development protein 2-like [Patiria miniata]